MNRIEFTINGECVPKARPRFSKYGHVYTTPKTRAYEKSLKQRLLTTMYLVLQPHSKLKSWFTSQFQRVLVKKNDVLRKAEKFYQSSNLMLTTM